MQVVFMFLIWLSQDGFQVFLPDCLPIRATASVGKRNELPDSVDCLFSNAHFLFVASFSRENAAASSNEQKTSASAPLFVPSKWESVDPSKAPSDDKVVVPHNRWELFADSGDEGHAIPPHTELPSSAPTDIDEDVDGKYVRMHFQIFF